MCFSKEIPMIKENTAPSWAESHVNHRVRRFAYYFASLFIGICIFALPLKDLIAMSLHSELYSYIPLIFVTSCYLLVSGRKEIFGSPAWSFGYGASVLILSLAAGVAGRKYAALLGANDELCVMGFSFWLFLMGTFILFFGTRTFKKAIFPLALLLFTIPFPALLLDKIVGFLQAASFTVTGLIFNALGFFPIQEGFAFKFPELAIEVARECSGIRSSVALVIMGLLCGHLFLRSSLNRILLVVFAVMIAIFKNGVRIVGLTLGTIYVDPRILNSPLHRAGGIPVFIFAFALLSIVVLVMRRLEKRKTVNSEQ
jgi:exosortase